MKKISATLLIILGIIHLGAQISFFLAPEEPQIVAAMRNFKMELFGTHNLLNFHLGFSWLTGFFLIFMGAGILFSIENHSRKWNLFQLINLTIVTTISVIYFHALANSFLIVSLAFFTIPFLKSQRSLS